MNAGFPNLQRWMRSIVITAGPSAREFRAFPPPPRAARRISNVRLPRGLPAQCSLLPRGRMVAVLPRPEQELRSAPLRRGAAPGLRAAPRAVLLRDLFSHSSPPRRTSSCVFAGFHTSVLRQNSVLHVKNCCFSIPV